MAILVAQSALLRQTPHPLAECTQEQIDHAVAATGQYTRSKADGFVAISGEEFVLDGEPYLIRGINYYPARYPWRRFLTETSTAQLRHELLLMREAGFNTLRLFLWNDALFQCPGSGAVPQARNVQRLDKIIRVAGEGSFRLIVTLNDLPDLSDYPLYGNPPHVVTQTAFLIERYRDEAAILAWDLRNEGDIDYGAHHAIPPRATKEQVLRWLDVTARQVRALDSNHLITAGWLFDAEATAPYVDFVSFHHWTSADELLSRIETMRAATDKAILLEEFGYSTQRVTLDEQATAIVDVATAAEDARLLGWMVWTAFDFPTDRSCYPTPCISPDNGEHYFGLWTADYTPKPALERLSEALTD